MAFLLKHIHIEHEPVSIGKRAYEPHQHIRRHTFHLRAVGLGFVGHLVGKYKLRFCLGVADGLVGYNTQHPALERALAPILEAGDGGEDLHKAVLYDIAHLVPVGYVPEPYGHHIPDVAVVESMHRIATTTQNVVEELLF